MFTDVGLGDYVAEKSESSKGWIFPVGDEVNALGYTHMFTDMFDCIDKTEIPMESFYDGYVVNAIMDACYLSAKSRKWEPVELPLWKGSEKPVEKIGPKEYDSNHWLIKKEMMPDGQTKVILKEKASGKIIQKVAKI